MDGAERTARPAAGRDVLLKILILKRFINSINEAAVSAQLLTQTLRDQPSGLNSPRAGYAAARTVTVFSALMWT